MALKVLAGIVKVNSPTVNDEIQRQWAAFVIADGDARDRGAWMTSAT
jgi:hypothetical protein